MNYANPESRAKIVFLAKCDPKEMQDNTKMLLYLIQNLDSQLKGLH